ncbi:MAG: 5-bromo-4-chloroindolyl phosphate hydrolysis family protein [Clostridiales bacterium]|nr:5-bromo-4-chloroindolyl phosphate hydrolysis family protein [Clostridiales bacterium]
MNNKNGGLDDLIRSLPNIPWWVIIACFCLGATAPAAVVLLIMKLVKDAHTGGSRKQMRESANRTRTADEGASRRQTRPAGGYQPGRPFPYVTLKDGKGWTVAGAILIAVFGLAFLAVVAEWMPAFPEYVLEDGWFSLVMTGVGIWMAAKGGRLNRQQRKYKRYLARMGSEPLIPLRPLAESLQTDMDDVCETLQEMIDLGAFGDRAYLDMGTETLVVDNSYARPEPKPKAKQEKAPESGTDHLDFSAEDKILKQIRDANDRIPDAEISRKIDRIEEITRHILYYLKKHPERANELHTFLDYYLPTTLKMLNKYAELDAQQVAGDNIDGTKRRIAGILDKVVEGFEMQLDKLFEGDMLDIASDIDVLERMLQRDGLSGEMKMPKAPQTPNNGGYTPHLTLDPEEASSGGAAAQAQPHEEKRYDDFGTW